MNNKQSIKNSIRNGNMLIVAGGLFITLIFTIGLIVINFCQKSTTHYSENLEYASDSVIEANDLCRSITLAVMEGNGTLSIDLSTPNFDKLCSAGENDTGSINADLKTAKVQYQNFKSIANEVMVANGNNKALAVELAENELVEALDNVSSILHEITADYADMTHNAGQLVVKVIYISFIAGMLSLAGMVVYSLKISARMSKAIATPVAAVAEWAERLSRGADHIDKANMGPEGDIKLAEIQRMVRAFTTMANNVKENVDVVRKVADGDMTAYVNIRSSEDSLGKSLYKMVQNNDIMFAQISQIADSVTEGTDSISAAAKLLADSCTNQATAISDFQKEIAYTNELVKENADDAAHASELSDAIHSEVVLSKDKMHELVNAMKAIYDASEKVSGVISNIESLANQTNLLAINATIEAKRAGEAGKSFAVVASSVKDLADKSAVSATQTKALIDDTIAKAKRGSQLSDETYTTFESIMDSLEQIIEVSSKIAKSGAAQQENMGHIELSIDEISKIVSTNAASSEETAAMTVEISKNAEVLKASMKQFNLRNRTPGKPYIPPEKSNDKEFIRVATDNYNKFLNSPEGRKIAKEMKTDKI